ncbi:MAG TPA: response regulator [Nitrospiraceae bacterium]|nr:response regulator [Nitrospiraceae bacterium]
MNGQAIDILLVEDNEDDILIIHEVFADMKWATIVNTVRDGEEALDYLQQKGKYNMARMPNLLLLDINMPKMNGFEVLQEVKRESRLQSLPVVMLTMSQREEDVARAYATGACSFIHKSVAFDQFRERLRKFEHYWTRVSQVPVIRG